MAAGVIFQVVDNDLESDITFGMDLYVVLFSVCSLLSFCFVLLRGWFG
jgi:hypothetical protein